MARRLYQEQLEQLFVYQALEAAQSSWRWSTGLRKAAYIAALSLALSVLIGKSGHLSGIFLVNIP